MVMLEVLIFLSALAFANSAEDARCTMRGTCSTDEVTALPVPCVYNGAALPVNDTSALSILDNICPDLERGPGGAVCCDADQLQVLDNQLAALASLFKRCPSCYHNLANLFCHQICSPHQSRFLEVTASTKNSVSEVNYYITNYYSTGLFDSCKNVKLASTSSRAMELCCGSHSTDCTPQLWLEYMGDHDPSPYKINFQFKNSYNVAVKDKTFYPMNEKIISCSEAVNKLGTPCSCVDCPSSCTTPLNS